MWFYLYLITTSIHLQHGWTLVNTTTNFTQAYESLSQTIEFPDPWKFLAVYQIPHPMQSYNTLLDRITYNQTVYNDTAASLEWYRVEPHEVESKLNLWGVSFKKVVEQHDEL